MTSQKHPNSKKITIFRAGSFINSAQTQAQEFMSMSKKSIGSYYAGSNKKGIASGLSFDEQDVLMPLLLDLPKEDRQFREKIKQFFMSISTSVEYGKGKELEIGLTLDNTKPVTYKEGDKYNLPIDLDDYIRYRHAIAHPRVAPSLDAAKGNMLMEFYIFDKDAVLNKSSKLAEDKDAALVAYLAVKSSEAKTNMMLTLLGKDIRDYKGAAAKTLKEQDLRSIADTNPEQFMKVYKQDNFEMRFKVEAMHRVGILKLIGSQYVSKETGKIVGHTLEETIYYLLDPKNATELSMFNSQLQEAMRGITIREEEKAVAQKVVAGKDDKDKVGQKAENTEKASPTITE